MSRMLLLWACLNAAYWHAQGQEQSQCTAQGSATSSSSLLQHTELRQSSEFKEEEEATQTTKAPEMRQISFQKAGPELGERGQLHSQVGQDWLVASILGCKSDGFFLDLAANDAMTLSNTLTLERDFGWRGICAEANFDYFYKLAQRRCQLFWGAVGAASNESVTFSLRGVYGGIVGDNFDNHDENGAGSSYYSSDRPSTVNLFTVPLVKILENLGAPSKIDYFSLDVEGAESLVMQDFPYDRYTFSVLTVERPKPELRQQLHQAGYVLLRKNSEFGDMTYVHKSLPDLDKILLTWKNHPAGALPKSCMTAMNYTMPTKLLP